MIPVGGLTQNKHNIGYLAIIFRQFNMLIQLGHQFLIGHMVFPGRIGGSHQAGQWRQIISAKHYPRIGTAHINSIGRRYRKYNTRQHFLRHCIYLGLFPRLIFNQ